MIYVNRDQFKEFSIDSAIIQTKVAVQYENHKISMVFFV